MIQAKVDGYVPRCWGREGASRDGICAVVTVILALLIGSATDPMVSARTANAWATVGPLHDGRSAHTATMMVDGQVLVVGGDGGSITAEGNSRSLASAELYDPRNGVWTRTKPLRHARQSHTATLLSTGQVLVVGGNTGTAGAVLSSSELYDPHSGAWAYTGHLHDARAAHTATLLPIRQVLVAGGEGQTTQGTLRPLSTAELYDPQRGIWRYTKPLHYPRVGATATLLSNGKVLVVGGNDGGHDLASAELYDSHKANWTLAAPMHDARSFHTATLLRDGRVLVCGGFGASDGRSASNSLNTVEIYDPYQNKWVDTASMSVARSRHTATALLNGDVLVVGGMDVGNGGAILDTLSSVELYDPRRGIWIPADRLSDARDGHTATLLQHGHVLVVGGEFYNDINGNTLSSTEVYN